MKRLHAFSTALMDARNVEDVVGLALAALVQLHAADMGDIQLYDRDSAALRIAAHRGFAPWFLDHFAAVAAAESSACARAMASRERVTFEDVEAECADESYREAARRSGFRAVQSTPLMTAAWRPLGIASTHFRQPRKLTDAECRLADILVNELSSALERVRPKQGLCESERKLRVSSTPTA